MARQNKHINEDDRRMAQMLKGASHPLDEGDKWFTPRVLNKLPEKRRYSLWAIVFYSLALIACAVSWIWLLSITKEAVTVSDCLYMILLMAMTGITILMPFYSLVRNS